MYNLFASFFFSTQPSVCSFRTYSIDILSFVAVPDGAMTIVSIIPIRFKGVRQVRMVDTGEVALTWQSGRPYTKTSIEK